MKFWQTLTLSPLYDAPNDGSGGGSSTDAGAAAAGAGAGSGAQSGAQGQPNGSQAGATTQPAGTQQAGSQAYTYKEDRSNWIPKHRFDEVNTQAARARELEQQLEQERQRVRALSGVEPTDPNAQRAEQVREAFFNLPGMGIFRKLAELNEEQIDSLLQVPDQVQQTQAQQMAGWQRHADEQIGYVADSIADAMGVEALDDDQKTDVRTQFTGSSAPSTGNSARRASRPRCSGTKPETRSCSTSSRRPTASGGCSPVSGRTPHVSSTVSVRSPTAGADAPWFRRSIARRNSTRSTNASTSP